MRASAVSPRTERMLAGFAAHGWPGKRPRADKGLQAHWAAFLHAINGNGAPRTPREDTLGTMRTVFAARARLRQGHAIEVRA